MRRSNKLFKFLIIYYFKTLALLKNNSFYKKEHEKILIVSLFSIVDYYCGHWSSNINTLPRNQ